MIFPSSTFIAENVLLKGVATLMITLCYGNQMLPMMVIGLSGVHLGL